MTLHFPVGSAYIPGLYGVGTTHSYPLFQIGAFTKVDMKSFNHIELPLRTWSKLCTAYKPGVSPAVAPHPAIVDVYKLQQDFFLTSVCLRLNILA